MERQRLNSSNIVSAGYDPTPQTLEIEFSSGRIYQYYDVPESVNEAFMNAPSHGRYFRQHIKDNYRYTRIR